MAKTKAIRDALRAAFYPHVLSSGFELDNRWQPQFVVFRRFGANSVQIFEIQWDKYHRPKFVLNFSEAPIDGVEFGGKWMDPREIRPVHCGTYLRLMQNRGRFTYRWFQIRRPLLEQLITFKRNYESSEIASQLVQRFDEVEDWWANKAIGNHIQGF